jgi:hypothetical protein
MIKQAVDGEFCLGSEIPYKVVPQESKVGG